MHVLRCFAVLSTCGRHFCRLLRASEELGKRRWQGDCYPVAVKQPSLSFFFFHFFLFLCFDNRWSHFLRPFVAAMSIDSASPPADPPLLKPSRFVPSFLPSTRSWMLRYFETCKESKWASSLGLHSTCVVISSSALIRSEPAPTDGMISCRSLSSRTGQPGLTSSIHGSTGTPSSDSQGC